VYTFQQFYADTGMHGVYVATSPESAHAAFDVIRDELAQVAANGLPPEDIEMGKSQLKGQMTLSLESVNARMYRAAAVELYGEPYRTLDQTLALVDAVTLDDVARVAAEFFAPDQQTVLSLGPMAAL
jgi:predicted Zn-dependent peptidase